jgi:hypothetical protein
MKDDFAVEYIVTLQGGWDSCHVFRKQHCAQFIAARKLHKMKMTRKNLIPNENLLLKLVI